MKRNFTFKKLGFTLAEVLITIGIIGIVAAITIPILIENNRKKETYTHLLKVKSTFEQGLKLMMAEDNTSNITGTELWINNNYQANSVYLPRYFNATVPESTYGYGTSGTKYATAKDRIYENNEIKLYYKNLNSKSDDYAYYKASQLLTGEIFVFYLFNNVSSVLYGKKIDANKSVSPLIGSILVDLNGGKLPNTIGKDIFSFYISDEGHLVPQGSLEYALVQTASNSIEDAKASNYYWRSATKTSNNGCDTDATKYTGPGRGCTGRIFEEKGIKYKI